MYDGYAARVGLRNVCARADCRAVPRQSRASGGLPADSYRRGYALTRSAQIASWEAKHLGLSMEKRLRRRILVLLDPGFLILNTDAPRCSYCV